MAEDRIRTRVWRDGRLDKEDFPFEQVSDFLEQDDCVIWADLVSPDHDTLAQLAEELSLDPHAIEDAMGRNERPKVKRYPSHLFITADAIRLRQGADELEVGRVSVFATRRAFVTVRLDGVLDIDSVVERWDDNHELLACGPKALLHGLLDEIVDGYFDVMDTLDDKVEGIENVLFDQGEQQGTQHISHRLFILRRAMVDARRAVLPMRDVINAITRHVDDTDTVLMPYFDDLNDHVLRVNDSIEYLRESIESVFETNMSLSDTRMNLIMKKLTSWAAIIAVPTAVTGYFGQNVPYPGYGTSWGFVISVAVIVVLAAFLYVVFRRKGWL